MAADSLRIKVDLFHEPETAASVGLLVGSFLRRVAKQSTLGTILCNQAERFHFHIKKVFFDLIEGIDAMSFVVPQLFS